MSAAPRKEVTTREVVAVRFGMLTDDEVRKLSVKRITSPITYDSLMNVVTDGLYDAALGPVDLNARCTTCGLNQQQCPGHFGHVELPVPVYNPLVFSTLYKLVRHTCFNCHHFKMGREEAAAFLARLECLSRGDLSGASAVRGRSGKSVREAAESILAGLEDEEALLKEDEEARAKRRAKLAEEDRRAHALSPKQPLTCHVQEALRDTVAALFQRMPPQKCANCGATNPSVKRQGAAKIFREYSRKALVANMMRGVDMGDAELARLLADREAVEAAAALGGGAKGAKRKRGGGKRGKGEGSEDDGWESEEGEREEEDDEEEEDKKKKEEREEEEEDNEDEGVEDKKKGPGGKVARKAPQGQPTAAAAARIDALSGSRYLQPDQVESMISKLCDNEAPLLTHLYGCLASLGGAGGGSGGAKGAGGRGARGLVKVFFLRALAVPPNKFRPPSVLGDTKYEHSQNVLLQKILNAALSLQSGRDTMARMDGGEVSAVQRAAEQERFTQAWLRLQGEVNALIDSTTAENSDQPGIRQQLEKKEGLFRKNMMGKRVNFAARSVISPDPFIGAGEIGVPPYFATRLSYPEFVTPWNVERLRTLVERGPNYPGAVAVEDEAGRIVQLAKLPQEKRAGLAKRLLSGCPSAPPTARGKGPRAAAAAAAAARAAGAGAQRGWVVYRHLMDGDIMLTNRQPTLHKPGLMAHKARVLKGERAIRLHYSNCATFNADFDGDEINLHLPQDHYGRAEGYGIVHADQQYIVPTDGKPIRGLIQDHVVSGVLLTKKDAFFTAAEFSQLLFNACSPWMPGGPQDFDLHLPVPAILKPRPLWSGKQLLSALVRHLARGQPPLTFSSGSKVPADYWGRGNGEGEFVFRRGELLAGTLDKAQFGKFGLVHAMQEVYGNTVAGEMLSALSRLLTLYLQWHGFTCGMDDLLLRTHAEEARQAVLRRAEAAAVGASAEAAGMKGDDAPSPGDLLAPLGAGAKEREAARQRFMSAAVAVSDSLGEKYRSNRDAAGKMHDIKVTGAMHPLSSEAIKACIPAGQVKPFPKNTMSLMTVSGAKGSLVNFSQIAVLLGQQELEGRRVPRMASGKTLPCFRPFDGGARSGGFVGDRFLTGLRPQEYYFHCMAGREGLVDTTVKTSRSGYLQRCLVKNLEALRVAYDGTVRDTCDGSVVQFFYGEDGLDVTAVSYLKQHGFVVQNAAAVAEALDAPRLLAGGGVMAGGAAREAVAAARRARGKLVRKAAKGDKEAAKKLAASEPIMGRFFPSILGATSEAFSDAVERYCHDNPDGMLRGRGADGGGGGGGGSAKKGVKRREGGAKRVPEDMLVDADEFRDLMLLKFMRSLAAPGEAVGVIAAQSIGEPSTQMTLNTFHMAGRGEANVTLGIPRLREILLTAAARIKTPTLTLPLRPGCGEAEAALLANRMRKLRLAECLKGLSVEEFPFAGEGAGAYQRLYRVRLQFYPTQKYPKEAELRWSDLAHCFQTEFMPQLKKEVQKAIKKAEGGGGVASVSARAVGEGLAGPAAGADDEGGDPGAASSRGRRKSEKAEEPEDFDEDEELREGKLRFRGGRGEAATYDGPDEEDDEAAAAAERELRQRRGEDEGEEQQGGDDDADVDSDRTEAAAGGRRGVKQQQQHGGGGFGSSVDKGSYVCEAELCLSLRAPKLLMLELAERVAAACVVRQVPGIERVHVLEGEKGGPPRIQTEGINFVGVWEQSSLLDVDRLATNDVHAMLVTYGVEAARATILKEASAVFGAYGIGVDPRHLALIADFMTHQGGYRPCNRMGIDSSTSPLLKMSFETAARFLTDASLAGALDPLRSPAARLCVGQVTEVGTGCCDVLMEVR